MSASESLSPAVGDPVRLDGLETVHAWDGGLGVLCESGLDVYPATGEAIECEACKRIVAETQTAPSPSAAQSDAAIAATLMKNRGMTEEQAVAETRRMTEGAPSLFSASRLDVKSDGFFSEIKVSDGRAVRLQAFLDSGGRLYTKVSVKRQGVNAYEEIVTTLEDGVHRYVQRGNRASV